MALAQEDSAQVRYALAHTRADLGDLEGALAELEVLAQANPADPNPLLEQGQILAQAWAVSRALERYQLVVERFPDHLEAGEALWKAGQLLEAQGHGSEAVAQYTVLLERFPSHQHASEARFRTGLIYYLEGSFLDAAAGWGGQSGDTRLDLWRGLALERAGQGEQARQAWEAAAAGRGYYAARARELLAAGTGFGRFFTELHWGNEDQERVEAEQWLASVWGHPASSVLPDAVQQDPYFARGVELMALGQPQEARRPFFFLIDRFQENGPALYALSLYMREHHFHALSIRAVERLIWKVAPDESAAPTFLLRLYYPVPYAHLIVPQAESNQVDPLLFCALMRQESRFDRYATSWAEARGLTQVIPSTGEGIAAALGFSPFRLEDLYRPVVSVRFGTWYLGRQLVAFAGQAVPALSAYNGGPGNARRWAREEVPVGDIDLFVERVDFTETRDYIERIYTSYWVYRQLYAPNSPQQ